jgi:hypothetical protein
MSTIDDKREVSAAPSPNEPTLRELMDEPSHVYFIYSAGLVKIGFSADWLSRTDRICGAGPHEARVILVMPGDRKMEAGYHALFSDYRANGEWFRCEGKMREFLMAFATDVGREELQLAEEDFKEEALQ